MMEKKPKVLFIANYFPPIGGPGVNRAMQFAKHLDAMGYELHVLTVSHKDAAQGSYPVDNSLLEKMPPGLHIHRIDMAQPARVRNFLLRLRLFRLVWALAFPWFWEPAARWPRQCLQPALDLIDREGIRLIWTTSGPFSSSRLGYLLRKRRPDTRWVCDLRDPYTDTYTFTWPTKIHWYFSRWMERRTFRAADKVVVVTPGMQRLYLKRGLLDPSRITVITNGYGDV
jgi:glycosyltransferase involved in cell wall biosynthesis